MIVQEYAPLARRTLKVLPFKHHLIHMGLGLSGEFGELIDAVKKVAIYGKAVDHINYVEEVGDTLWYAANLLPELMVQPMVLQMALDDGYTQGTQRRQQYLTQGEDGVFSLAEDLLTLNTGMTALCSGGLLDATLRPAGSNAVRCIEAVGGLIGTVAGVLNVDLAQAMQRNIEKLSKRYGDKFSDVAALNRDLAGERAVLEGGAA